MSSANQRCQTCGAELPEGAPGNRCPKCLLELGLSDDPSEAEAVASVIPPSGGPGGSLAEAGTTSTTEKTGNRIGRYKLLQQIGEGGMGIVYMAEQREPVIRKVALKIIKAGMDTRQVVARFEAERQALALMDHPNIAKVLDGGATDSGRPYFVMDLVQGLPITQFCDEAKLSMRERLELFLEVCSAIQHAHQKGIIHRDIKPSNILVTLHGDKPVPKVIDFGIAKATQQPLTDKTLFTQFQHFIGTPAYMSPEQASLSGLDIDTRSDIYGLGVLLYELLTGQTPFDGKELLKSGLDEMRRTIREKEPPRPSTRLRILTNEELTTTAKHRRLEAPRLLSALRGDLDWIVMKCLEKDRARRYETANGLSADVRRYLSNEAVIARPPSGLYRFRKAMQRNKATVVAVGAIGCALMLGSVMSTWQALRATKQARRAQLAEMDATEKSRLLVEQRDRAEANLYAADMLLAEQARNENNLGKAADLLDKHRPRAGHKDFRDWEWRHLWKQTRSDELFNLHRHPPNVNGIAMLPDGRHVVTATGWDFADFGEVRVMEFPSGRIVRTFKESIGSLALSPDGLLVASGAYNSGLKIWEIASGKEYARFPVVQDLRDRGLAFSPDGKFLAAGDVRGSITVWDVKRRELYLSLAGHRGEVRAVAFTGDGTRLVSGGKDRTVKVWNLEERTTLAEFTKHQGPVQFVGFSPDGEKVVSASWDSTIRVWSIASGSEVVVLTNHTAWVSSFAFSPDGTRLASAAADHTVRLWDTTRWEEILVLRGNRDEVSSVIFSLDGSQLITGAKNGDVKVWPSSTRPESAHLPWPQDFHSRGYRGYNLAQDGTLALLHTNDTFSLWDSASLRQRSRHPVPDSIRNIRRFAVAHAGKALAYTTYNRKVKVWSAHGPEPRWREYTMAQSVRNVAISPSGKLVAASATNRIIKVWRTADLEPLATFVATNETRNGPFEFFNDDLLAVHNEGQSLEVWNLRSGQHSNFDNAGALADCQLLPHSTLVATAGLDALVRLWDLKTGTVRGIGRTLNGFSCITVSPDGRRVAAGSGYFSSDLGFIVLWDPQTGQELGRVNGHTASVDALAFLPDGNALVSVAADGVRVWRAPSWEEIAKAERAREDAR